MQVLSHTLLACAWLGLDQVGGTILLFCSQSNQFLRNKQVITTQQSPPLLLRQDRVHRQDRQQSDRTRQRRQEHQLSVTAEQEKTMKQFTMCCGASRTLQSVSTGNQADFTSFTRQVKKALLLEANSRSSNSEAGHQTAVSRVHRHGWRGRGREEQQVSGGAD